jgi:hypothetical protein
VHVKKDIREKQRRLFRLNTPRNSTEDKLSETENERILGLSL